MLVNLGMRALLVAAVLVLAFALAAVAQPPIALASGEPDFRATRFSISMPARPRRQTGVVINLAEDVERKADVFSHIAEVFDVPQNRIALAQPELGEYLRSEWEHELSLTFDPGYRYCRTRVYEYLYIGYGAAAMDATEDGISVLAYLHPGALRHPTLFRIELELLTVRDELADGPLAREVCRSPQQPFYQRFWGGCC